MAEEDRFSYHFSSEGEKRADIESTTYQKYTIDKGVQSSGVANFVVEGHDDDFIDTTRCYLKTQFRIVREDGEKLEEPGDVFLAPNYAANLWGSVSVSLNNTPLAPANDYAYTALLIDLLGASPATRDGVLAPLSGWSNPAFGSSKVASTLAKNPIMFDDMKEVGKQSKEVTVFHRIYSDFLQSCSQLLPNKMQLGINLVRGKDSFVLARDPSELENYRVEIVAVHLYVRRVRPNPSVMSLLSSKLGSGGKLHYQRIHVIPFQCPQGSLSWTWHNCFNNILPNRVFLALVTQEAYYGSYGRIGTYLESVNVSRVRFCRNGREVTPEPYTTEWKYENDIVDTDASNAKSPFTGLTQAINVFAAPRQHCGIEYSEYLNGSTVWGVTMEHSEVLSTVPGSLDIQVEFSSVVKEPLMVLVLGEYPKTVSFDGQRNMTEV